MSIATKPVKTRETKGVRRGDPVAVTRVAAHWHGGSDHNITGVSHNTEWTTTGLISELDGLIERFDPSHHDEPGVALDELLALKEWAEGTYNIYVFDSLHFHEFMDSDGVGSCNFCGARYDLVHTDVEDVHRGRYRNSGGEDPNGCTRKSLIHGDRHETGHELDCESGCPLCQHNCNCDLCRG